MEKDFFQISESRLKSYLDDFQLNLYIKLGASKFVKFANAGDEDSKDKVDNYIEKGVSVFYLDREGFEKIYNQVQSNISDNIEKLDSLEDKPEEMVDTVLDAIEEVKTLVRNMGLSEAKFEIVDQAVKGVLKTCQSVETLEALLEILNSKDGYIKEHGMACSYISTSVLKSLDWNTEDIEKKIIMSSIFQNVSLETEEHARIFTLEDPNFTSLDEFEQDLVRNHPFLSAELVTGDHFFSNDVEKLIRVHHELPNGKGFPKKDQTKQPSQLEALMIISSFFAHQLIIKGKDGDLKIIAQELNEYFNDGVFKKNYQSMLDTFTKTK
ncbi:MAG: hypothetical protein GY909_10155 [Oligoflexia bacterium]|nr:hypothetical protein [Oligoflexia bacterium]